MQMRAIGYKIPGPIERPDSLLDIELPRPEPAGRDILVEVRAISVNPADTKLRAGSRPPPGEWKVLGYDVAGVVSEIGPEVTMFGRGDEVFYAGDIMRPGGNAEFHLVDERIVGHKPRTLSWAEAAALPLTSITAWEALFDRLDVSRSVPGANSLLIIGGAGGVGSIAVQLARRLTDLEVIATASGRDAREWVAELGAHHVIDHMKPLSAEIKAAGLAAPGFVFSTSHTDAHLTEITRLIAPQGRLALIDDPQTFDVVPLKNKAVSIHWELMFARSMHKTADMVEQARLLDEVARLLDAGAIRTTLAAHFCSITAENLKRAHALVESGRARGKVVLEGFPG
jgi:zinc-binding alcohol dehydrogenase family protein